MSSLHFSIIFPPASEVSGIFPSRTRHGPSRIAMDFPGRETPSRLPNGTIPGILSRRDKRDPCQQRQTIQRHGRIPPAARGTPGSLIPAVYEKVARNTRVPGHLTATHTFIPSAPDMRRQWRNRSCWSRALLTVSEGPRQRSCSEEGRR